MKRARLLLSFFLLFSSYSLLAQKPVPIFLKESTLRINPNINEAVIDSFNKTASRANNKAFALLQFDRIPSEEIKKSLAENGIFLLDYIPDNAYTASIDGPLRMEVLKMAAAKVLVSLSPEQKMHPALAEGKVPAWASKVPGTIDVLILFPKTFNTGEVVLLLKEMGFQIIATDLSSYRIISIRIAGYRMGELASLPFVEYVQPAPGPDQPLNQNSRAASRANVLNASIANGGKGLNGEGVVIGVGDNSDVQTHADFSRRLINRAATVSTGHGHHVTGIIAGAGNVNELYRGYAPKATIISQVFSGILTNAAAYVKDYGMVITNNSYGNINECDYHGLYDLYSRILDQQAFDLPYLENVFAAGNSGSTSCLPGVKGFRTVYGGYQSAKNVITVGATNDSGALAGLSSKGPVRDGRIKPEITAMGEFVASAWPTNIYSYSTGTSMAAPAVSGGLALLYQRYRQLNGGANPKSALMKAIVCNGATDKGAAGPDFGFGFGGLNLLRSVEMIEKNQYVTNTISNGSTAKHSVVIPANTAQLKVMLYWHDPASSLISRQTLVNDLDLEVSTGGGTIYYPQLLDTAVRNLTKPATTGADHANNIEQVVIDNPASGNYSLTVKGTAITQNGSQEYFVVYDVLPVSLQLTYPVGGETLVPSYTYLDPVKISWDAFGNNSRSYSIQFSMDGGASWADLATNLDPARRIFTWWVPNVATGNGLIRIVQEGTGLTSTSKPFAILNLPTLSLAPVQCEGYISINWTAVSGATDYELMILQGEEMKSVGTTTNLFYTYSGLNKDSTYFVTARPRINGVSGRRPSAIIRQPNSGNCVGSISDNDLKMEAILSPLSGRKATATELTAATPITIQIKNLDDAPASNVTVSYSVNQGSWITEPIPGTIAPGASYTFTFSSQANLSAVGEYKLCAVVKNGITDPVSVNDTVYRVVKQLDNPPLNVTNPFVDNIESAAAALYPIDTIGLDGLDRYDFENNTIYGRLRTFVNSGMAYSGAKALTLDADRLYEPGNTNYLIGTYNTVNYNALTKDLRLDFQYNNHGQLPHQDNKVWIRGSDKQPWIEVYDLNTNEEVGVYKRSSSIELSDWLTLKAQNFSSSFQVRWGQFGQTQATDKETAAGYSFDDIRLYQVFNDLQMIRIDSPVSASCGLSSATAITITVRNSATTALQNVPVKYRVDKGPWVQEIINTISGKGTITYTFKNLANFSTLGLHLLETIVDYAGDSFHDNDTASITIINSPVITTFPYLQNFEKDNGYWYSGGKNASWEYGTPASDKIKGAASGAKAWKTRLVGNYNDAEASYLYSPCFDITGMVAPTLSFSMALDLEDCGTTLCDGGWLEYSVDGITWVKLGKAGEGTNWYNQKEDQVWSQQSYTRWHVATTALPKNSGRLRFRFVIQSDVAVNREGIAIDDIHIYDNTKGIYDGETLASPITNTVSGNTWIDFTSNGKLIASLKANNQNLGPTEVQAYINKDSLRYWNNQYYHNRNITIKPAQVSVADSVKVRFYFLDSETDSLIKAKGCLSCLKPASAYELGVSKYSDINDAVENGTIDDNKKGLWSFINQQNTVIVPFDKGYYAEFGVKDFSEFWLSKESLVQNAPARVQLASFTAEKSVGTDVLVTWSTLVEENVLRFEIEVAKSNEDLQANKFVKVGFANSKGNATTAQSYAFTDTESPKTGVRYYRLKIVLVDGSFQYSEIKPVLFTDGITWQIYPNPSTGLFYLVYQVPAGSVLQAKLMDAAGKFLKEYNLTGNGFVQKYTIDLTNQHFPAGVYLLQMNKASKSIKVYKQ